MDSVARWSSRNQSATSAPYPSSPWTRSISVDQSSSRRMTEGTTTTSRFGTGHLRGLPDPARVYEPATRPWGESARRVGGPWLTSGCARRDLRRPPAGSSLRPARPGPQRPRRLRRPRRGARCPLRARHRLRHRHLRDHARRARARRRGCRPRRRVCRRRPRQAGRRRRALGGGRGRRRAAPAGRPGDDDGQRRPGLHLRARLARGAARDARRPSPRGPRGARDPRPGAARPGRGGPASSPTT